MRKVVVLDPRDLKKIIRERRSTGADRLDEVWNGVYVMSPSADNLHQFLAGMFVHTILQAVGDDRQLVVLPGANVSDREDDWRRNYRCPDVLVFLPGNPAEDRGTHYRGGPDFAVEVLSERDRSRKKLGFYAAVGVRELLLVDRRPWRLELYRRIDGALECAGTSDPARPDYLTSAVLDLNFRLLAGEPRPRIEVSLPDFVRAWLI
jgi:Uma2 family endonuclease